MRNQDSDWIPGLSDLLLTEAIADGGPITDHPEARRIYSENTIRNALLQMIGSPPPTQAQLISTLQLDR